MSAALKKPRILVAAEPRSIEVVTQALDGRFELDFISTMTRAVSYSYDETDVILCDIYFDESRLFDFLRYAKSNPGTRSIPFICINTIERALSKTLVQGIEISCKALKAVGFADLCRWQHSLGCHEAHLKLCLLIDQVAHGDQE